jgi:hypothetical protein
MEHAEQAYNSGTSRWLAAQRMRYRLAAKSLRISFVTHNDHYGCGYGDVLIVYIYSQRSIHMSPEQLLSRVYTVKKIDKNGAQCRPGVTIGLQWRKISRT